MATEAKNVRFRKQLAKLEASRAHAGQSENAAAGAHSRSLALQDLRPAAGGLSEIRHLPYLFPQLGK